MQWPAASQAALACGERGLDKGFGAGRSEPLPGRLGLRRCTQAQAQARAPTCDMTRTPSASVKGRSSACSGCTPPLPPKLTTPSSPTCGGAAGSGSGLCTL